MGLPPKNIQQTLWKYVSFLDLVYIHASWQHSQYANYGTHHYHLVLSHKTYQNQGICDVRVAVAYCHVTKMFVARNKFPHVKVARNTKKVGQAWSMHIISHLLCTALCLCYG